MEATKKIYRNMRINRSKQKGVATIEFAIGFMAFWAMCMVWAEMSYMSYISAVGDLAIATTARDVRTLEDDYKTAFEQALTKSNSIWPAIFKPGEFKVKACYFNTINALNNYTGGCAQPSPPSKEIASPIAIYSITYDYNSLFTFFISATTVFSREVIVIQENRRVAL